MAYVKFGSGHELWALIPDLRRYFISKMTLFFNFAYEKQQALFNNSVAMATNHAKDEQNLHFWMLHPLIDPLID